MSLDDDENPLAGVDLHKWQVPPPPTGQRSPILHRALTPAVPPRRNRTLWMIAGAMVLNAAIATIIAIVVSRPDHSTVSVVRPAGGAADAQVEELLRRLDNHRRELERRLAELDELRALANQLAEQVRTLEDRGKRKLPSPKPSAPLPADKRSCDEVSCVLSNYDGACCATFKRRAAIMRQLTPSSSNTALPEGLDRAMISRGIANVKGDVVSCGEQSAAKGKVKVSIVVNGDGRVTTVVIVTTPDASLGACVAAAIQRATFEQTLNGGSFTYPFVF